MSRPHGFKAWLQVVRCYQKGLKKLSERLQPLEVTSPQLDVLANLFTGPEEGMTQEELSQRLLVTKGNVSGLLDRLGERGLIERRAHPGDRRSNLVLLTEKGRALAARAVDVQNAFVADLMTGIEEPALQAFERILTDLETRLEHFSPFPNGGK